MIFNITNKNDSPVYLINISHFQTFMQNSETKFQKRGRV
jgi:hypothetical protein